MVIVKNIPLAKAISKGKHIRLLSVDVEADYQTPFACVRYAVDGVEEELGICVDLDKRVALDAPDDPAHHKEMDTAVERLIQFLRTPRADRLIKKTKGVVIGRHYRVSPRPLEFSGAHAD
ncbi:MAG: hypothetical protein HY820_33515 [Acidobacteria bacterium]|nr:hypothetical protein [Acidobacteriota bacterium]